MANKKGIKELGKIEKLPKNVVESIPFIRVSNNGIIETSPGTFTKAYKLVDTNFKLAPGDEQAAIFSDFMNFLNSFNENTKWQILIHNHTVDKHSVMEKVRIKPQRDGLNKYRQELNNLYMKNLSNGKSSLEQSKYLITSVTNKIAEQAIISLNRLDTEVTKGLRKITQQETRPMTTEERLEHLYRIYNPDNNCPFYNEEINGVRSFNLEELSKKGLSAKDIIGPSGFGFSNPSCFTIGDVYGQALYLNNVPQFLSSDFIADLTDITCEMLISLNYEPIPAEKSIQMVRNQMASIDAQVAGSAKRSAEDGYGGMISPELERAQVNARDLMNDITSRNQKLFLMTMTIVVFGNTKEKLDENVNMVKSVANKHICDLRNLRFQQEFGLNTTLPLCRNDLMNERLYTSESVSVFIPYTSQEITQENAIYYGQNQSSENMILYNRLSGKNYNALVFGESGTGKSFICKCEMVSVLLNHPNAQVMIIDPQGEYYPLAASLDGEHIPLAPGSKMFLNPLDLDLGSEEDPITMKSDFVSSMIEVMLGKNRYLDPVSKTVIDRCVRRIYRPYVEYMREKNDGTTCDIKRSPILSDLYQELKRQPEPQAQDIAEVVELYANGSLDTFAHRTNVQISKRFVVYDIKQLGTGMKDLGLFICLNDVWNRMMANSKKHIYTWFYIDEFHLLLKSDNTAAFLEKVWKMARKWLGVPTGIMQNTEDLLRSESSRAILNNSTFIIMLSASLMDRRNLAELLHLSDSQLEYITNAERGHGLIYNGKFVLPFKNIFPKNTELYSIMSTSHDVKNAAFA